MAQLQPLEIKRPEDIIRGLGQFSKNVVALFKNGIRFDDNFDSCSHNVSDTGSADTEFNFSHGLGRVPVGFFVTKIDKGGVIYDGGTTWTNTTIYLKCSAANADVTLEVF